MPTSIVVDMMRNFPVGTRSELRNKLTLGPHIPLGMWSWCMMDGSTWAAVAWDGTSLKANTLIGWAGFSQELDLEPVIGVYIDPARRGEGFATRLVAALIVDLMSRDVIQPGETVFATTSRWPKYFDLLESLGINCEEWT